MNVDNEVGAAEVFQYGMGHLLGHRPLAVAGEDAVHVEVEVGYAALYGVDAERVEGRVDVNLPVERADALVQSARHFVAHHLPFQFVAMGAGDDADALVALRAFYYVFPYRQLFAYWQVG